MIRLFQIEWIKAKSNMAFWALLFLYMIGVYVLCSIGTGIMNMSGNVNGAAMDLSAINMYNFPQAWHNLTYISSYLKIFLGIAMIVSISNELQQKTLRQNIIDGLSKIEFVITKIIFALMLSLMATLLIFAIGCYFGMTYADQFNVDFLVERLDFVGAFFLQTFAFLLFSLFIGILIRSTGLTIAYSFLIETFAIWIFFDSDGVLAALLPMNALDNLIQFPVSLNPEAQIKNFVGMTDVLICSVWLVVYSSISYLVLCKKDL
jgi:ABC-2 type transport system permease protein